MASSEEQVTGTGRRERIRAFFALDPPAETIATVAAWQRLALRDREGIRAIDPGKLHLTLAFLGDRRGGEIERARDVLANLDALGPVTVGLGARPVGLPRRRPRVVAFDAESATAATLQGDLADRLVAAGLIERPGSDGRPFRPHLSVARIRGDLRNWRSRRVAIAGLPPLFDGEGHTFDAVRVALYRSELRSQGARYSALADVELPHRGGG